MKVKIVQPAGGKMPQGDPRWFIIGGLVLAGLAALGMLFAPIILAIIMGIGGAMIVWGIILAVMQTFNT